MEKEEEKGTNAGEAAASLTQPKDANAPQEGLAPQGDGAAVEGTGEGLQDQAEAASSASGNNGSEKKDSQNNASKADAKKGQQPKGAGGEPPAEKPVPDAVAQTNEMEALVKDYSKLYPRCRQFHVTSDRMVFLENDLNAAQFHQHTLPDGQVKTLKRAD